ncbi:MAG: hypothetical protein JW994_02260 [Candidatus Omnitrophica bacterium]|nr:hypothetical protein [Candidatus Omnitrophota bacterium]
MRETVKKIIAGSKAVNFLANLNKNILLCFYNSQTHKLFRKLNGFLSDILKKSDKSLFRRAATRLLAYLDIGDWGLFIILVVLFNTLVMFALKKEIDVFSVSVRVFLFCLGALFIFKKKRRAK